MPFTEFYAEQLRQVQLAEELGFDTAWLTEHHFVEDGYSPSLMPLAAAIAARTTRLRIGTFLLLLPLHHPVAVAEAVTAVDLLSGGRVDFGVGQGYVPGEFAGYGVELSERATRLEEAIEVVRGLWTHDTFSYEGRHYRLADVSLAPKPAQQPHPPIWIGARTPKSIERAARLGCSFLGLGEPDAQRSYDAALVTHGRDPAAHSAAQLRFVYVAPTEEKAWADTQDHLHYMLAMYARWRKDSHPGLSASESVAALPAAGDLRSADSRLLGSPLIGTPEAVAAGLEDLVTSVRTTHLVLGMHLPGLDPGKSIQSMLLFAHEVLPLIQGRTPIASASPGGGR